MLFRGTFINLFVCFVGILLLDLCVIFVFYSLFFFIVAVFVRGAVDMSLTSCNIWTLKSNFVENKIFIIKTSELSEQK